MQRYFIASEQFSDKTVSITKDDAHHVVRVMRAKEGDKVIVSDGISREALVQIRTLDKDCVLADIVESLPMIHEPSVEVWIAQSLPKGDKMEVVIQKGTEIGAARFIPFASERTVVQLDAKKEVKKIERWQKIAKEAAEQAHRNVVPVVELPMSWKALLQLAEEADAAWICYEKENGLQLKREIESALAAVQHKLAASSEGMQAAQQAGIDLHRRARLLLIVGPEGGFSEREVEAAEMAGCRAVSLGKRILRTETAAMVGLTCILYESGEMGGS